MELQEKTILITGGTSGVGKEMVQQLASQGNRLIVLSRNESQLKNLESLSENIRTMKLDLSKAEEIEWVTDEIVLTEKSIDILINNAAVQYTPRFLDDSFTYEFIAREIQINFTAVCQLTYLLLPVLLKETPSIVLNINSGLALAPKTSSAIYCATKGALNTFSTSLGYQLKGTNISVQQAFLPLVDTPMTSGRGSQKMKVEDAAREIIKGLESDKEVNLVGKVKILSLLLSAVPPLGRKIMRDY